MDMFSTVSKKSGKTYFLHSKAVSLSGITRDIYYFAGAAGEGVMAEVPAGYEVVENPRSGLPMLKKAAG